MVAAAAAVVAAAGASRFVGRTREEEGEEDEDAVLGDSVRRNVVAARGRGSDAKRAGEAATAMATGAGIAAGAARCNAAFTRFACFIERREIAGPDCGKYLAPHIIPEYLTPLRPPLIINPPYLSTGHDFQTMRCDV